MELDILTSSYLGLRDKLHRIAMRYLQSDADADDALQDTWLRLKSKGEIRSEPEARNKLVAVLRNVCIDSLRKSRTVPPDAVGSGEIPAYSMETEDMDTLEKLLQEGLTPQQRQIFSLVTHSGCDYEEIAETLGMSVEAVRMSMSRIRRKIRETYNKLNA